MFDEALVETFRPAIAQAFLNHGDVLRSVGIFFDYRGALNDAAIQHGIWLGAQGPVIDADAIVGSLGNSLKMVSIILERGFALHQQLTEQLTVLSKEILEREKHLAQLQAQWQGRPGQVPVAEGLADATSDA